MKICLQAKDESQRRILEYLENNASDILIDKINNGVQIEKDGKQLLSKKDLDSFFLYANTEAKKLADNNNYACIEDKTAFGWAVHYFEEESIEGKLFNLDGSEYLSKNKEIEKTKIVPQPKNSEKQQASLFDFCDNVNEEEQLTQPKLSVDIKTGEVISSNNQTFDKYILKTISVILDGKVKLQ